MFSLGVDIGGSTVRAALVNERGGIVASQKEALSDRSLAAVVEATRALVELVSSGHDVASAPVGVGFAGMLRGDVVVNAPNLGWRDVDFGGALSAALKRRVRLVNDLSAAAWGERTAGAAKGAADTFTVFVGTGVGSAIIAGGALLSGSTGVAAEFGHVKVVADGGRRCGCGELGCLEAYAGGAKLTEWMRERGLDGTPQDLERRALANEAVATELYDFAVGNLSMAVANQVTVLNPAVVVLGGGVLMRCPEMVARIRRTISSRASVASNAGLRVELAALGDDSGLVGAALLAHG